ncbi:MAG: hypothetical protein F4029_09360 [Gammaproteobacteria bacterium]|nr:hypothetical protein [Gammaproteobacteria bacterium]MYF27269.1 hypothetical protein [Gammaproteobacteria bacterium]MYK46424.1 hypothetical protein [Gammaproteobacteria bacterium]
MATCIRIPLIAACCAALVSCVPVASLAPTPLDGRYVAVINAAMVESAALPDAGPQRAEKPAAAVARWRGTEESED